MHDATTRKTATILSFDERVRALRPRPTARIAAVAPASVPTIVFGGAWYHDAAIREQDPTRKG